MKKNEVTNVNETIVENIVMDNETMQAVIEDNMHLIPKNQLKKFESLTLEEKVKKIQMYQDRASKIEQMRQTNKVINRVKDVFEKRNGTIQDAKEVIKWCTEFIDTYRQHEIEKIDIEIARLEELKQNINA